MARFILVCENTRHCCHVSRDEMRDLIDVRKNPGGYTDVDRCIAMIENPEGGAYQAFPLQGPMGPLSIHVEGRLDYSSTLRWKEPGHRCTPRCLLEAPVPSR
jgi:hypothetical protein